jgi:hypothetical protein
MAVMSSVYTVGGDDSIIQIYSRHMAEVSFLPRQFAIPKTGGNKQPNIHRIVSPANV